MYIVTVTIFVKPEFLEPFIAATLDNAQNTRKEPKNLRFDVSQAETEPTRFLLYEVYQSKEDFAAHHQTAHYLRWKDTVANVVQFIETKQHQFYTKEGNASAWVGVRTPDGTHLTPAGGEVVSQQVLTYLRNNLHYALP